MKRRKVLTEDEARYFLVQICSGVQYIHGKGVVHRDLKLGNMFLTSECVVKIGDFGLAAPMVTSSGQKQQQQPTLCGTPNYIAPEVRTFHASYITMAFS